MTFKDGTTVLGTASVANDRAVLLVSNLAIGNHAITATYGGDTNFAGSSAALSETVTPQIVATTIVIQPITSTAIVGQQIALSANVTPAVGTATPDGSVTFRDGATLLGAVKIDPSGHSLLLIDTLGTGNHTITATFGGSGIFAGSTSAPVTVAVRLGSNAGLTAASGIVVSGQPVALTANVGATAGGAIKPAGNVTFYDGTAAIGSAPIQNGVAKLSTSALKVIGTHRLTAVYGGSGLFATVTTNAVYITVRAIGTTTTVSMPAAPAAGTGIVTLTAAVAVPAPGVGPATGKVTFFDGTTTLGSANVAGGLAILKFAKLPAGSHYIRAVFSGTGAFGGSSSAIVHYTIAATTSTTVQATAAAFGQTTSLKATVTILSPGFGKASGQVVFMAGNTVLGTATLLNGVATLGVKLSTGAHNIVAKFEGTSAFATSASTLDDLFRGQGQPGAGGESDADQCQGRCQRDGDRRHRRTDHGVGGSNRDRLSHGWRDHHWRRNNRSRRDHVADDEIDEGHALAEGELRRRCQLLRHDGDAVVDDRLKYWIRSEPERQLGF